MNLAPPAIPPRARSRPAGTRRTDKSDSVDVRKGSTETVETVQVGRSSQGSIEVTQDGKIAGRIATSGSTEPSSTIAHRNVETLAAQQMLPAADEPEDSRNSFPQTKQALSASTVQSRTPEQPLPERFSGPDNPDPAEPQRYSMLNDTTINLDNTPMVPQRNAFPGSIPVSSPEKHRKPSAASLVIPERSTSRSEEIPAQSRPNRQPQPQPSSQWQPPSQAQPRRPPTSTTVSPFSSPLLADGFEPPIDHSLGPAQGLGQAFQMPTSTSTSKAGVSRSDSSDMDASSMTTGTGTSVFPSPMITPPQESPFHGILTGGSSSIPSSTPEVHYPHGLSKSGMTATCSIHSNSNSTSFFKRPYPVLPASSSASIHSVSSAHNNPLRGSTTPSLANAAGYVNARMAREEERKNELESKREKENKDKTGVVKDGYKIVDGVEKKRSTSGVYTPATFPGATGKKSRTPSMTSQTGLPLPKTPETTYSCQTPTPPPLPDSATSNYFSRTVPNASPGGASSSPKGYTGSDGSTLGKTRGIIGALKSPSFTGVRSAMSDGWRRSSAEAAPGHQAGRLEEPANVSVQPRHGSASAIVRTGSSLGSDLPVDRLRSASEQMPNLAMYQRQSSRDGLGLGLGEDLVIDSRSTYSAIEAPSEYASARTSLDVSSVPPPAPSTANTRPRNVKNLSLPLSNMHGVAEKLEESIPPAPSPEPFSPNNVMLGTVAKGVRRKPVPQS